MAALPGHEVYKLTPEQLDAWRKAAAPSEAQWAESVKKAGEDPKQVMDRSRPASPSTSPPSKRARPGLTNQAGRFQEKQERRRPMATRSASYMDRFINTIEWLAAIFVGIVALNIFVATCCCASSSARRFPTPTTSAACCWAS
jgi:hypothetical protein